MTNIPVRVMRDGAFKVVDVDELTDSELAHFFAHKDAKEARRWAIVLAAWIRDNISREVPV